MRKCFSAYDRYSKVHDLVQGNIKKVEVFGNDHSSRSPIVYPVPKRFRPGSRSDNQQRLQSSGNGNTSQSLSNVPTTPSPDVEVRKCIDQFTRILVCIARCVNS